MPTFGYLFYKVVAFGVAALFVVVLLDVVRRRPQEYEGVSFSKNIWMFIAISGTVIFGLELFNIYLNMGRLLEIALLFAGIFYIGPVRDRLGPRGGGGGNAWGGRSSGGRGPFGGSGRGGW